MNEWSHATELPWLWAGLVAFALATFMSFRGVMATRGGAAGAAVKRSYETPVFLLIIAGVMLLAMALAERWMRIGHGPFVNRGEGRRGRRGGRGRGGAGAGGRGPVI